MNEILRLRLLCVRVTAREHIITTSHAMLVHFLLSISHNNNNFALSKSGTKKQMPMMRTSLRFVCIYLSTSCSQAFRPSLCRRNMTSETGSNVDYGVGQADIGDASPDKDLAEGKSWRELIEISSAKSRKIRGSNYVQLATVDPETNAPRCRCVVFRGFQKLPENHPCSNQFLGMSCVMRMITDARSQKVRESRAAELLWWFPKSSEQYRVRGSLHRVVVVDLAIVFLLELRTKSHFLLCLYCLLFFFFFCDRRIGFCWGQREF